MIFYLGRYKEKLVMYRNAGDIQLRILVKPSVLSQRMVINAQIDSRLLGIRERHPANETIGFIHIDIGAESISLHPKYNRLMGGTYKLSRTAFS